MSDTAVQTAPVVIVGSWNSQIVENGIGIVRPMKELVDAKVKIDNSEPVDCHAIAVALVDRFYAGSHLGFRNQIISMVGERSTTADRYGAATYLVQSCLYVPS